MLIPFLFITIACGAISGFHCLVSSGTTSKQLKCETDAQFVGYGSMLTEGFLATLVILACVAGIGLGVSEGVGGSGGVVMGEAAYAARYASWGGANGLAAKVGAFVDGSANFVRALGVPAGVAVALMGVLVASFAATTLDTACRLQRYVIQELAATFAPRVSASAMAAEAYDIDDNVEGEDRKTGAAADGGSHKWNPLVWLTNKHGATIFAVVTAGLIAALPMPGAAEWNLATAGTGGMILWPLFGATNQLLAGLAFLVIAFFLWRRGVAVWFVVIPMVFMLFVPAAAMLSQLPAWINPAPLADGTEADRNWVAIVVAVATLLLEFWMIAEALWVWPRAKGVLEEGYEGLKGGSVALAGAEGTVDGGRSC